MPDRALGVDAGSLGLGASERLDVVSLYARSLARRGFASDAAQRRAVERLQRLHEEWVAYKARRNTALKRLLVKPPLPRGVYLWGGVGRGKSFLMDSFFLCVPLVRKRRVHFHHFMREIHRELDALKGTEDPIAAAAARAAKRCRLICFDEFHVSDIADAMILGRYLEQVMDRGVVLCMTSNFHPDELYANGLQRERFQPTIDLLKQRLDLLQVDGGIDYRRRALERLKLYHVPPGAGSDAALGHIFGELAEAEPERGTLEVEGRRIATRRRAGGVVWFDFAPLCAGPRSYADYLELARRFHTIVVSGVPKLSARNADAARRFTWLVDVLYDARVKLAVSAEARPEALFADAVQGPEAARTASRLHEMQSAEYLHSERIRG